MSQLALFGYIYIVIDRALLTRLFHVSLAISAQRRIFLDKGGASVKDRIVGAERGIDNGVIST